MQFVRKYNQAGTKIHYTEKKAKKSSPFVGRTKKKTAVFAPHEKPLDKTDAHTVR